MVGYRRRGRWCWWSPTTILTQLFCSRSLSFFSPQPRDNKFIQQQAPSMSSSGALQMKWFGGVEIYPRKSMCHAYDFNKLLRIYLMSTEFLSPFFDPSLSSSSLSSIDVNKHRQPASTFSTCYASSSWARNDAGGRRSWVGIKKWKHERNENQLSEIYLRSSFKLHDERPPMAIISFAQTDLSLLSLGVK